METELDIEPPGWCKVGGAWIKIDEVQAWRWAGRDLHVWFRHREDAVWFECDHIEAKAFELAIKNT